jgi:hypothetical protein
MPRLSSAEKVRRFRARQAGAEPPIPQCPVCGVKVLTDRYGGLCVRCFRRTPEYRKVEAERKRRERASGGPQ